MNYEFDSPELTEWLDNQPTDVLDTLDFGVVKMDLAGTVLHYSKKESDITGVQKEKAEGKHFFTQIAPCTNNFLVAEKYKQSVLDEQVPYIFTYVTNPISVLLRLMKGVNGYQYMCVKKVAL